MSLTPQQFTYEIPLAKFGTPISSRVEPVSLGVGTWVEFQAHGMSFGGYIAACHHDEDGTLIIERFRKTKP